MVGPFSFAQVVGCWFSARMTSLLRHLFLFLMLVALAAGTAVLPSAETVQADTLCHEAMVHEDSAQNAPCPMEASVHILPCCGATSAALAAVGPVPNAPDAFASLHAQAENTQRSGTAPPLPEQPPTI